MEREIVNWQWHFPGGAMLLAALALLGIALGIWAYARTLRTLPRGWRWTLTALRLVVFLLLLACLTTPQLVRKRISEQENPRPVAVLMDVSGSMTMPGPHRKTRLDIARAAFAKIAAAHPNAQLFSFAEKLTPLASVHALSRDGGRETRLIDALRDVQTAAPQDGWGSVVVFTDGNDTSGDRAKNTGEIFREKQTQLVLAATDNGLRAPDLLRLQKVELPAVNRVNTSYPLDVFVHSQASVARDVTVRVTQNGATVAEAPLALAPGDQTTKKRFEFQGTHAGFQEYEVQLIADGKPLAERFFGGTQIVERQQMRALFYAAALNPEYRFIKAALAQNPSISVEGLVQIGATALRRQSADFSTTESAEGFPKTLAELSQFDVIVLSEVTPQQLSPEQTAMLLEYVKRGGGLLFLASSSESANGFANSPLEQLLPVVFEPNAPGHGDEEIRRSAFQRRLRMANGDVIFDDLPSEAASATDHLTTMKMTPDATAILGKLGNDAAENAPSFVEYAEVQRAKPGALVLGEHPTDKNSFGQRPLLAVQRFGAGRSALLTAGSIWRWRMSLPSRSRAYETLWQQLLLWLGGGAGTTPIVQFSSPLASLNDRVSVHVTMPARFAGANARGLDATVHFPDGKTEPLALHPGTKSDELEGEFVASQAPGIEVTVRGAGMNAASALLNVRETPEQLEQEHLALDLPLLRRIAQAAGGQVINAADLQKLPALAPRRDEKVVEEKLTDVWNNKWIFGLLIGVYGCELILRRRLKLL